MYGWINALGDYANFTVNKRGESSTSSDIVGGLTAIGEFVEVLEEEYRSDGIWSKFKTVSTNERYWIRGDVYRGVVFGSSMSHNSPVTIIPNNVVLNIKYHSQNDQDSNMSPNDCGPASSTIMLERAGISTTVNDFMVTTGINHTNFTTFNDNIRGLEQYYMDDIQIDAEYRRPVHVSDVLLEIGDLKNPVFCLVYYAQLNAGKDYGHFLVAVGYKVIGNALSIILHDPNRSQYMSFPIETFADALAYVGGSGNMPFQALFINNYFPYPESEVPDPNPEIPEIPEIPNPETPEVPEVPDPEVPEVPDPPDQGTGGPDGIDYEKSMLVKMDRIITLLEEQNEKLENIYMEIPVD